uniref:Cytosolic non-specific dipeptidase 2 n=1 Tax=Spirometra erinaceieuropaei TaxID=99802 RepID=A0A0F6MV52_SPIER|nr:cytosolic non-specific dipeptidase 2 [Spirometra erinaceieuropaei]
MDKSLLILQKFIEARQDKYIKRLKQPVAIQSISSELDHRYDVLKALRWCALKFQKLGFSIRYRIVGPENVYVGDKLPLHSDEQAELPYVVCAEYGNDPTKRTVLIYGHVDVKPIAKDENWTHDPFDLQVVGEYMWGRGVTDDKGPVVGWLNAIEAYAKAKIEIPVNIRVLLDGSEETGSEGIRVLLNEMKKDFLKRIDYVAISDNYWLGMNTPCLTYGLRGVIYFYVYVEGPKRHLHSGAHGGAVQEPLEDLDALLASLVDKDGRVLVPNLYDTVRKPDEEELRRFAKLDFTIPTYGGQITTSALYEASKVEILQRKWCLPCITVHGIEDSFDRIGAPTLIPKKVMGKFSVRIVPDQNPRRIADLVRKHLESVHKKRRSGNRLEIKVFRDGQPFLADHTCPNFTAAKRAITHVWGKEPDLTRDGATISMAVALEETTNRDVVLIPMGQCLDFQHEVNERLSIKNYIKGIQVFACYLFHIAALDKEDSDLEAERQLQRKKWRYTFW